MITMKICCMLLLFISVVHSFNHRFKQRSSILHQFQDLLNNDEKKFDLDRRVFDDDDQEEPYLVLRATTQSNGTNTGVEITLQNKAAMNTRLRVIYVDGNGKPDIAETGRLWSGQTKSVKLPLGAQNINVIIEKDLFFETWRVAYKGTLTNEKQCLRITGVTLFSKIHSCD